MMTAPKERPCILCGTMTTGSVGAAGIKWTSICQPCKDREDKALEAQVRGTVKVVDAVFGKVAGK